MTSKATDNSKSAWLEKPWVKLIGAVSGACLLIGIGFSIGVYKMEIECNLEQMEIRQEFNEKLVNEIHACQNERLNKYESTVNDLKEVIEHIKDKPDGN